MFPPPQNDKHHHEQRRPKNQPKTHLDTEHSSRAPSRTTASPAPSPNRAIGHQLRPQPPLRPRPRQPGASYTAFPYLQLLQPGQNVPRLPSAYPDYSVMFPSLLTYCSTAVHPLTHCRVRLVVTARLRNGRLHISLHMSPFPFRSLDSTRRRSTSAGTHWMLVSSGILAVHSIVGAVFEAVEGGHCVEYLAEPSSQKLAALPKTTSLRTQAARPRSSILQLCFPCGLLLPLPCANVTRHTTPHDPPTFSPFPPKCGSARRERHRHTTCHARSPCPTDVVSCRTP